MTPAARVQTAIELLDRIIASARDNGQAADTIIAEWFKTRRFAGSGDRRAVRELVYRVIRAFGELPESGRAATVGLAREDAELALLFDGSTYGPATIVPDEPSALPQAMPLWLSSLLPQAEHSALLERAPLDLRANRLKTSRAAMLGQFPGSVPIEGLEDGLRLSEQISLDQNSAYREGLIEVQDAGSQHIVALCGAGGKGVVIDLCAGAGGKTLALAASMSGQGRLVATDTDRTRLAKLGPRAARSGATVETRLLDGGKEREGLDDLRAQADVVLVDAPCTGSGTLRRNPEARWRITPERLSRVLEVQCHVLDLAVPLVNEGGALVYAVCSLIDDEGQAQVASFLDRHPGWTVQVARSLTPSRDKTDGFFVARLIRAC